MTMMTRADIRAELGWSDDMIHALLQTPDSPNARHCKNTGEYTYGLYKRERVLAADQTTEGRTAKRQWGETLRGDAPNPGWTTRLGDIGRPLGSTTRLTAGQSKFADEKASTAVSRRGAVLFQRKAPATS